MRRHAEGCPAEFDVGAPIEGFEAIAVAPGQNPDLRGVTPGSTVTTVRCLLCAGARYFPDRLDDLLERTPAS